MSYITVEDWTTSSTTPDAEPGQLSTDAATGITYVYVYNAGAGAISAADAVGVYDSSGTTRGYVSVTDATMFEINDGTTTVKAMSGIAVGSIAAGSYGWLYAKGYVPSDTATTDGSITSGVGFAIKDATKTIYALSQALGHLANGYALAADSSTTLTGFVLTDTFWLH